MGSKLPERFRNSASSSSLRYPRFVRHPQLANGGDLVEFSHPIFSVPSSTNRDGNSRTTLTLSPLDPTPATENERSYRIPSGESTAHVNAEMVSPTTRASGSEREQAPLHRLLRWPHEWQHFLILWHACWPLDQCWWHLSQYIMDGTRLTRLIPPHISSGTNQITPYLLLTFFPTSPPFSLATSLLLPVIK